VLIVQSDAFNRSQIRTVIAVVITSNLRLADAPGNVLLPARVSGLSRDSVVNISQVLTLDRSFLTESTGKLTTDMLAEVEAGLRLVLQL